MGDITLSAAWVWVIGAAGVFLTLSNVAEKITKIVQTVKAPNAQQETRIKDLEDWRKDVDRKLKADADHLESIDMGNRATQRALLALLDHGIDGNNIEQMQHAKEDLQTYLLSR